MKVKDYSRIIKMFIVTCGLILCMLKWLSLLPNATVGEIWLSMSAAYGIALGTIDFNIIRDTWVGR